MKNCSNDTPGLLASVARPIDLDSAIGLDVFLSIAAVICDHADIMRWRGTAMRIRIQFIRPIVILAASSVGIAFAQNDWPAYGRDPGAQRFSPLAQINAGNVQQLIQAWKYETRTTPSEAKARDSKTTPLMVNNVLYFATSVSIPGSG